MPSFISQTEIDEQERISEQFRQDGLNYRKAVEYARKKAELEGEEEKRKNASKPIIYYCTNLKCLVELEQLPKDKIIQEKISKEYQCPSCNEIFSRDPYYAGIQTLKSDGSGIEAISDLNELRRLKLSRDKYLNEAREIRKKLDFLEEWKNKTS